MSFPPKSRKRGVSPVKLISFSVVLGLALASMACGLQGAETGPRTGSGGAGATTGSVGGTTVGSMTGSGGAATGTGGDPTSGTGGSTPSGTGGTGAPVTGFPKVTSFEADAC